MIICATLSGVSVLLAVATLAVVLTHSRKEKDRYEIINTCVDVVWKEVSLARLKILAGMAEGNENIIKTIGTITEGYTQLFEKIEQLESGMSPDYEAAKEAAASVNSFNIGLSNLLGYDPFEALKKSRKENGGMPE